MLRASRHSMSAFFYFKSQRPTAKREMVLWRNTSRDRRSTATLRIPYLMASVPAARYLHPTAPTLTAMEPTGGTRKKRKNVVFLFAWELMNTLWSISNQITHSLIE